MKRLLAISAATAAAAVTFAAGAGGESGYRFTTVFESAQGIVPGQLVKIAGARVGSVEEVELIPGRRYRARLVLEVGAEHGPFGADASCRLLPEGLISERFVDCDPGSPAAGALRLGEGGLPELTDTATPLSLQDVLNIFSVPTADRLRILFNELGIGTAGNGANINRLLRRSNPALSQANRVLEIIAGQRERLAGAVSQTDRVLAELARDEGSVAEFVSRGSDLATRTAAERGGLSAAVRNLPELLEEADGGLSSLDRAMSAATPLLGDLRRAGPAAAEFANRLSAFSIAGLPAIEQLTPAARTGREVIPPVASAVAEFEKLGEAAPSALADIGGLTESIRDSGGWRGFLNTLYGLAVGAAARDDYSHYYGAVVNIYAICILVPQHLVPAPGCDHSYDSPEFGKIPINDPQYRSARQDAFKRWLALDGPAQAPAWMQSSLEPLMRTVAEDLGLNLDRLLRGPGAKPKAGPAEPVLSQDRGDRAGPATEAPAPAAPQRRGPRPLSELGDQAKETVEGLLDFLFK